MNDENYTGVTTGTVATACSLAVFSFSTSFLASTSVFVASEYVFALFLNEIRNNKFKRFVQTATYIPHFISMVVFCGIITDFFSSRGIITSFLAMFGGPRINYVGSNDYFRHIYVWTDVWKGLGWSSIVFISALTAIDQQLYEAATIDGANKWQMFRKITLPYVIFVTTPYLIQSFIGNITSFNTIFLLTGGGPTVKGSGDIAGHTDLLVTWLYKMTIDNYKYNAGSIIGILTFMITASITLICYRNSKAYKEEDTFQ